MRATRRWGLTGALLMAVGGLGAGALPVPNPFAGLRVLGLPARNPTLSVAVAYAGLVLLVVAWWGARRQLRGCGGVVRLLITWAAPLAVVPPLFSRDVYSYLAQGAILARGLDPYRLGPAAALGVDHPLTRSVPAIWRDTPSPYGPLATLLSRGIDALTRDDVVAGVLAHRGVALAGLALTCWALPRLARRTGVDPARALWLGAANPLVLFHVVSGAHNDALMVGLMLVGAELAHRFPLVGAAVVVTASAVKIPALLALGYLGVAHARRRGGRPADVPLVAAALLAVTVAVYLPLTALTGPGWITAPFRPTGVLSLLSPPTDLALVASLIAGHIDDPAELVGAALTVSTVAAAVVVAVTLARTDRDVLVPLATGFAAVALLAAPTQPWYLLWALTPLAAAAPTPRLHRRMTAVALVAAVVLPPTGTDFVLRGFQLVVALAGAGAILAAVLLLRNLSPSRVHDPDLRWAGAPRRTPARRAGRPVAERAGRLRRIPDEPGGPAQRMVVEAQLRAPAEEPESQREHRVADPPPP